MRKGVPVSPGFALARAYCLDRALGAHEPQHVDPAGVPGELDRLDQAWRATAAELDALVARVEQQVGQEEAAIFFAHEACLAATPPICGFGQCLGPSCAYWF